MGLVVPAVIPSSRQELWEKLELFSKIPSVSRIQIDVVDGRFASPASWPYTAPEEMQKILLEGEMLPQLHEIEYEIDLMCIDAERAAGNWLALGASRITFHAESSTNLLGLLDSVKKKYGSNGFSSLVSFGIAINIESDLVLIKSVLDEIEYVQFMGITKIGKQGQLFDERVFEKIRTFHSRHPEIPVQVDGGVSHRNAAELVKLGVSNLIIGSALVRGGSPSAAIAKFEELKSSFGV